MSVTRGDSQIAVSVVIPCFNSGGRLSGLVRKIHDELSSRDLRHEFVLVDDASTDSTFEEISNLISDGLPVKGLQLRKNSGQHYALLRGIIMASAEFVITMDDDGQNPVSEVPLLLDKLSAPDADLVYGKPRTKRQPLRRRIMAGLFRGLLVYASGEHNMALQTNFRAFRRNLIEGLPLSVGPRVSIDALLLRRTSHVFQVEVEHLPREAGVSGYRWSNLLRLGLTLFSSLSTRLLRLSFLLGVSLSSLAIVLSAVYGVVAAMNPDRFPGFTSLAVLVLLTFSLSTAGSGIVSLFLARILESAAVEDSPATVRVGG